MLAWRARLSDRVRLEIIFLRLRLAHPYQPANTGIFASSKTLARAWGPLHALLRRQAHDARYCHRRLVRVLPEKKHPVTGVGGVKTMVGFRQRKQPDDRESINFISDQGVKHIVLTETFTEARRDCSKVVRTQVDAVAFNKKALRPPVRIRLNDKGVAFSRQK